MSEERSIDKLARYAIWAFSATIIVALCWYFRNVLIYMIIAAVVSLLGRPIMRLLRKLKIKGKSAPDWLLAILTLILVIGIFLGIITQVIPVVSGIIQSVSSNLQTSSFSTSEIARWADRLNVWLIDRFPNLGRDFKIQESLSTWLMNTFDISSVTSVVGSVASALGALGIGLFCVVFISFFFIKDEKLFRRIVKTVFTMRRKMMRNGMKQIVGKDAPLLDDPIFNKRPEQLSVQDYINLTNQVSDYLASRTL